MSLYDPEKDVLHISIIATGRCNARCTYCHFYGKHKEQDVWKDISDETFYRYVEIIKYIKECLYAKNITCRFSGGDPLVIGDRMFDLSQHIYQTIGRKINILTNGRALNSHIMDMAETNGISAFVVSLENPFDQDIGAVPTCEAIARINEFDRNTVRVVPGVVIVKNSMFNRIGEICDYFFDEIGCLPTISELNFSKYEKLRDRDLKALHDSVVYVIKKYAGKADVELFPYIIPELGHKRKEYLLELDLLGTKIDCNKSTAELANLLLESIDEMYPKTGCAQTDCDWFMLCERYKGLWKKNNCFDEYCRLKKTLCSAFFEALS